MKINKRLFTLLALIMTLAACGGNSSPLSSNNNNSDALQSQRVPAEPINLETFEINNLNPIVTVGYTLHLTATGHYSDLTTDDVTGLATWQSSDVTMATVSNSPGSVGLVTGLQVGSVTISAFIQGMVVRTVTLTIIPTPVLVSISVTDVPALSVPGQMTQGATQQFVAMGTFSDSTVQNLTATATWSSSNIGTATVNSTGLVTAIGAGSTVLSASQGGITSTPYNLTVVLPPVLLSLSIAPNPPLTIPGQMAVGTTQPFVALALYSGGVAADVTSLVTWNSSNTSISTVNSSGVVTAVSVGTTCLSVTLSGITSECINLLNY